ncbi:MAG: hypothetical protein ACKO0Z_09225 [Betaproteobacteria bacterium]
MPTLAQQLDQIMDDHKRKTQREYDLLSKLDMALAHVDGQMLAHVKRIVADHHERKNEICEIVNDLHHTMLGLRPYDQVPPVEEREVGTVLPHGRAAFLAGSIMDQLEGRVN